MVGAARFELATLWSQTRCATRLPGIGCEGQAACLNGVLYDIVETRLIDGNLAILELFNFALVHVHTEDVVANIRQASTSNQANITGSNNRYFR